MSEQIKIAQTDQPTPGQRKLIRGHGHNIALFNLAGAFYAISNTCSHSTGPLVEGKLFGTTVTYPWHGAQFDVTTGQCLNGPAITNVVHYPVEVKGDSIFIKIP